MSERDPIDQDVTQAVHTPADAPAPVQPVTPPAGRPKASRARWIVALGGAAAVVAVTAAIVAALVGRSPDATVLGYVPSGAVMYGELRLDLPGDQSRKIGEFLSKFPGFADQSALPAKLDETLDRLIADATKDKQTYTQDIKPWFGGEFAFSVGPLPDPKTLGGTGTAAPAFRGLALLSLKDGTLAKAWFDGVIADSKAKVTTEAYGGTTLTISAMDGQQGAFAIIDGKVAVIGDIASVKAAIDTKGAGAFAKETDPKAALAAAPSDHLGLVYVAVAPLMDYSNALSQSMLDGSGTTAAGTCASSALTSSMTKYLPAWSSYWVRAESDGLAFEGATAKAAAVLGPTSDRGSDIAKHIPGTAVFSAISHDDGATLLQAYDLYKSEPCLKDVMAKIEQGADLAGGVQAIVGWIGDTAIVVDRSGSSVEGGLIVLPTDHDAAARLLTSLRGLITLSGGKEGLTVRQEDHAGVTITIVDAGSIKDRAGSSLDSLPPGITLPSGDIELAWAVSDQVVVIGSGPDFVKHVLDTTDATSLAGSDRYKALAGRVGDGVGTTFVDIAAIREMTEGLVGTLEPSALKHYETDVKPYLAPFDALIASGSVGGDVTRSKILITVK